MIHIAIYFSDFMAIQKLICLKIHHGESLSIPLQLNFQNEKWSAYAYPPLFHNVLYIFSRLE